MTRIEVKATPEWLVQRAVELDNDGNVMLLQPSGDLLARITPGNVFMSDVLGAVRAWLVQQIEAGYHSGRSGCVDDIHDALGVSYTWEGCVAMVREMATRAKDKAKPTPTTAAAEDAAIDGLVDEAIRDQGRECNAYTLTGERSFYVGETDADVRPDKARIWLKGWLLAAWARGVAHGQQPDAPPALAESFGVAAREQIAAERAVDAAAVAPSEDALAAAHEKGRVRGWGEAIDAVKRAHEAESKDGHRAAEEAARLRQEADHAEDTRSRLAIRAVATGNVLDAVTAAAPKEAP